MHKKIMDLAMMRDTKGNFNFNFGIIGSAVAAMIGLAILFQGAAAALPEVQHGGNNLSATGAPLTSLFGGSGVMILAIVGALALVVLVAVGLSRRGR